MTKSLPSVILLLLGGEQSMTITMTAKNQITIPKKLTDVLSLGKGSMFDVRVEKNRIELIPLETKTKGFTKKEYEKLEILSLMEKGQEKPVSQKLIKNLKEGKI